MLKAVMVMNFYSKHDFVIDVLSLNKGNMTVVMNQTCWCKNARNALSHSAFDFRSLFPESLNGGN